MIEPEGTVVIIFCLTYCITKPEEFLYELGQDFKGGKKI